MAAFTKLEDSPMFRKQVNSLEQLTDELKQRCSNLHKGCKRFMGSLDEGYAGDLTFADALEAFGAGQDDPVSVAIGGPVMSKFTTAFRELGTYKELLRSQVEHMLSERLMQFMNVDLHGVKDCRQRLDRATVGYDQAREKFVSVRKGTRAEVVTGLEEDLHNAKSSFERCRFNLVHALANIEAKKKYEFLESISAVMDAHLRYFKQGYELLSQMEPFIHQVLTYAQQSKEMAINEQDKLAKRIQEYRTQEEIANLRMASNVDTSTSGDGIHVVGLQSYKKIEALMQSTANGEVQIIKQGYLFKRSENSRGEWKRRFFVLNSHGTLYYYGNKGNKQSQGAASQQTAGEGTGVFSRFRFLNQKASSQGDNSLTCRTIDLRTSTIKIDAEENDLRFCFRIISPVKAYTLQAETGADQKDWIEKITGVIASLLNLPFPRQVSYGNLEAENHGSGSSVDSLSLEETKSSEGHDDIFNHLRNIPGNDSCAECRSPDPDWASLNLGILICIECSGAHRNLGVHISKVRSLRLDVKVWEPVIMDLFHELGNDYTNSIWEAMLPKEDEGIDESNDAILFIEKPKPTDAFSIKERYIQSKYVDKLLFAKNTNPISIDILEAIRTNDVRTAYHILVLADVSPNMTYDELNNDVHHDQSVTDRKLFDPSFCDIKDDSGKPEGCLQGCSLLHIACQYGHSTMAELLLLFGADINKQDFHGRTPLHHCAQRKNDALTKHLLKRGARTTIKDGGGLTALERRMELGAITDEDLFILFVR
ncbi:ADP-ribosylation factor GTPase-activating protein AGD2-like isoform X1 [Oryza brachyantha]|uniref:ADP-ribosylation factor GTPase-activating protein AGD2-like isoform X1 n=2 Tax=Oryza brachyantha TaxID=4533 RepID=UPI0003EAC039|nr:ADP-ribosylation factor GTPase-activating protein AGD2-like isoform X1 [Oryza brachyantha]